MGCSLIKAIRTNSRKCKKKYICIAFVFYFLIFMVYRKVGINIFLYCKYYEILYILLITLINPVVIKVFSRFISK